MRDVAKMFQKMSWSGSQSVLCCRVSAQNDVIITYMRQGNAVIGCNKLRHEYFATSTGQLKRFARFYSG